jgi:two-component system chemotaxis response regulator CheB
MPRMNGLEFLARLMRLRPLPVVMVSTLTQEGAEVTLRALELGAVDFVAKPKLDISRGIHAGTEEIVDKIRIAARARARAARVPVREPETAAVRVLPAHWGAERLILVGASTGGTEAIKEVLVRLPADCPAVAITQHMPAGFTRSFAERLDGLCRMRVKEAAHNERLVAGHAYIAPGDWHLRVLRAGSGYVASLDNGPPVNRHRPSVDVLFRSAACHAGRNAIAVILTGMGSDGAQGMLELKKAGAYTIAQDEASCVVYGMPKEAVAAGAVDEVLPLSAVASRVLERLSPPGQPGQRSVSRS